MPHHLLNEVAHRPYPVLTGEWVMTQIWYDLLFAHWPIDAGALRPLIPQCFEIDTLDGQAYIAVVPFGMRNVRLRYTPNVWLLSNFLELNVRTYAKFNGKSGVYFFSLDAANPIAVEVARMWYSLPYFNARMSKRTEGDTIEYRSERIDGRARHALLDVAYRPVSQPYTAKVGSIERWLTERYCLYTTNRNGQPVIGEIHHKPWPLQKAEAEIRSNTMVEALGLTLPDTPPLLHFAREIETIEWAISAC